MYLQIEIVPRQLDLYPRSNGQSRAYAEFQELEPAHGTGSGYYLPGP